MYEYKYNLLCRDKNLHFSFTRKAIYSIFYGHFFFYLPREDAGEAKHDHGEEDIHQVKAGQGLHQLVKVLLHLLIKIKIHFILMRKVCRYIPLNTFESMSATASSSE
jgi:hypothetical protein